MTGHISFSAWKGNPCFMLRLPRNALHKATNLGSIQTAVNRTWTDWYISRIRTFSRLIANFWHVAFHKSYGPVNTADCIPLPNANLQRIMFSMTGRSVERNTFFLRVSSKHAPGTHWKGFVGACKNHQVLCSYFIVSPSHLISYFIEFKLGRW